MDIEVTLDKFVIKHEELQDLIKNYVLEKTGREIVSNLAFSGHAETIAVWGRLGPRVKEPVVPINKVVDVKTVLVP